ncbi:helix-turn-helix transcriptional regulator [Actinoplanes sp. NPDC051633]|uniref:helix-turn-helix transcriptional regulator n=1 Tax=Actinoplanes sp. NPDC051633 TaxID=3155670 RepID=UPI003419AD9A
MDRVQLADFLRTRRQALQPEDVGLPRGPRRRTGGLRREEVAALSGMSADYYSRIEQQRGPKPSEQMLAAIARALHLSQAERDHLFRLGGHAAPQRVWRDEHLSPALMRILDRLDDTPAEVISRLGETLRRTSAGVALLGDDSQYTGMNRSIVYRWFTDPDARSLYPSSEHEHLSRFFVAAVRQVYTQDGPGSRAAGVVDAMLAASPAFAALWKEHHVSPAYETRKLFQHPDLGELELHCQTLLDQETGQSLLVYTATPGSPSQEKLRLLAVIGKQKI